MNANKIQIGEGTKEIKINSKELEIKECSVKSSETKVVPTQVNFNENDETCTLTFDEVLKKGPAVLSMSFKGVHNDKMCGFYRTKVTNGGADRYNLVTQFCSTSARQCFPCWDEPALKSTFSVTLNVPKDFVALSNMNVVSEKVLEDQITKRVVFAKSKKMSTYLLAFVIGEFDYVQGKTSDGIEIKVYTPPGKSGHGSYPLEVAIKSVKHFTNFFDCPYPMNKLDLIAISDFSYSAMENWGLITFRESALLVDEQESSEAQKQWVTTIVCHEVSHQWFGNLVTMKWWTHLWLNEGFATFMQYEATDVCYPKFKIWEQYVNDDTIRSLELDSLKNSHAIEVPVNHPAEVDEIFDVISYQKGGNIIRMIYFWIGAENFKKGMRMYFKNYAYSNTQTEDLWKCLESTSGKPVEKVMSTWTKQMGFPVINASIASENADYITLNLSQQKFCLSPSEERSNYLWQVPLNITTSSTYSKSSEEHQSFIITSESSQVNVEHVGKNAWLKINPGFCGFYRVNYSDELLSRLVSAIKDHQLNCFDRLNIINDVSAMALAGQVSFITYFDLLETFKNETEYPVWKEIVKSMSQVKVLVWDDDQAFRKFVTFQKDLFSNIMNRVGMKAKHKETHLDSSLRKILVTASNDDQVNKECMEIMKNFFEKSIKVDSEIRASVYEVYVSKGGLEAFKNMTELHMRVDSMEEKNEIEIALGCVGSLECVRLALQYMMSSDVRDNERYKILKGIALGSKVGRDESWKFVKENWNVLYKKYGGNHLLAKFIDASTPFFSTEDMLKEVKEFLTDKVSKNCDMKFKQCVEKIELNIYLRKKNHQALKKYFS